VPAGINPAARRLSSLSIHEGKAMLSRHCAGRARPAVLPWLVGALAVVLLAGCGPGRGKVSGRVLYQNAPLSGGWVTFRPADPRQNTLSVPIEPDGQYEATLPAGEVLISVDNRELEPAGPGPAPELPPTINLPRDAPVPASSSRGRPGGSRKPAGSYVPIPEKYYSVDTSGLRCTVKGGSQHYDITLE
jgi:hypothetical protein